MKVLCFDIESTINNKGQPFDTTNKLVSVAWSDGIHEWCTKSDDLGAFISAVSDAEILVGFNIKFDIN